MTTRTQTKVDDFCAESPDGVHKPVTREKVITIKGVKLTASHTNCKACRSQLSKGVTE